MAENEFYKLEQALAQAGKAFRYPATPPIAARVRASLDVIPSRSQSWLPRPALVVALALVIALSLLVAFPETREAVAQFLGLRTVRIIQVTPTPTAASMQTPPLATPLPTQVSPLSRQCCLTTLEEARASTRIKILLPPGEPPTQVRLQDLKDFGGAQQLVFVFGNPDTPRYVLYEATGFLYGKIVSGGTVIQETRVKDERALWLSGAPHLLVYLDAAGRPQFESERVVDVNTLAWELGNVTYRLETKQSQAEAVQFAEALR